jgi:8-hydroxy-5-deazaflavin:NADPH oxidoreductase
MRIGVLGTGVVGKTVGARLISLGHEVTMGSRAADNPEASAWAGEQSDRASHGTFADAAAFGELVVNATAGAASLDALTAAGAENLAGKVLIDIANPLDFSKGMPPTLTVVNTDSLAEQIQRAFPQTKVVKALNTMTCFVMVEPSKVPGSHNAFVCGDDEGARATVVELLRSFGWPGQDILDLGDLTAARGMEMVLPLWIRLMMVRGGPFFNFKVAAS